MATMEELTGNKIFIFLGGVIALIMGSVLVTLNNIWTSGIPFIITIIGWLALLKGVFLTVFPGSAVSFYKKANKSGIFILGGLVVLVLGLIMLL